MFIIFLGAFQLEADFEKLVSTAKGDRVQEDSFKSTGQNQVESLLDAVNRSSSDSSSQSVNQVILEQSTFKRFIKTILF